MSHNAILRTMNTKSCQRGVVKMYVNFDNLIALQLQTIKQVTDFPLQNLNFSTTDENWFISIKAVRNLHPEDGFIV